MQPPFWLCDTVLEHTASPWLWLFVVTTGWCNLEGTLSALRPGDSKAEAAHHLRLIPHCPFCTHRQVFRVGSWPLHFSTLRCPVHLRQS